ncbi:MAG: class I SAM-dependent methyltransferase [Nitrospirae bacterium]|nr:class I SAM-dependent methyltransferase [Nitrospirota bacterium]
MNRAYLKRFKRDQRIVDLLERRAIRSILSEIAPRGPFRVLDVPCGYGRIAGEAGAVANFMVQADRSAEILSLVHAADGSGPRVCCDIRHLPFRSGSFDLVCVVRLWHHLRDAEVRAAVMEELGRVSTRYALVSHYRQAGLHALSRRIGGRFSKRVRINMLAPGQFEKEAETHGFSVTRTERVLPLVHAQTLSLLVRN